MLHKSKKIKFISDGIELSGVLTYIIGERKSPGVLFIHGGGKSSKERFARWQNNLIKLGINSLAFDLRGDGESKGEFVDSSLNNRLIDSVNALNFFLSTGLIDKKRVAVIGSSMGAYIAIKLSKAKKGIKALILVSPAAYAEEAESKKMNALFTKVI